MLAFCSSGRAAAAAPEDVARARQAKPGASYRGADLIAASATLNVVLERQWPASMRRCESLDIEDVDDVIRMILPLVDAGLDAIYRSAGDTRALRFRDRGAWEAAFARDAAVAATGARARTVLRDGKCHEAVMLWTHHLTEAGRRELYAAGATLPTLPASDHGGLGGAADRVALASYAAMTTCSGCHTSATPDGHRPPPPIPGAPTPTPWPEAFTADSNVHGALAANVTTTHKNDYRYRYNQSLYVHHPHGDEPECRVLLENFTTWAWLPSTERCAKIFVGHGAPPRTWVKDAYYAYDGVVTVTDDYGNARRAKKWSGVFERGVVDANTSYYEDDESGLPLSHQFKVLHRQGPDYDREFYYNVTIRGDEGPIARPAYCPDAATPPLYNESYPDFRYLCHF